MVKNHLFIDIEPDKNIKDIKKQDYLKLNYNKFLNKYNNIHIIGNPPFGKQSSLAKKFIEYSTRYCNTISFILPKSFKKPSMNAFPISSFKEIDLPENSFSQ